MTVLLAHDAAPPLSLNLSCPFLLSTSRAHICVQCKKAGGFSRRTVLGTLYFCACKLRFSVGDERSETSHSRLQVLSTKAREEHVQRRGCEIVST